MTKHLSTIQKYRILTFDFSNFFWFQSNTSDKNFGYSNVELPKVSRSHIKNALEVPGNDF